MVLESWDEVLVVVSYASRLRLSHFHAGAVLMFMYPCQDIAVRTPRLSDVVVILSWHEGEGLALRFL